MTIDDRTEWLEPDGLGGFASGTASGIRTRRYHALLLPATTPPTGRVVLVNGLDAWVETPQGRVALTTQRYAPGVLYPDGASRIVAFSDEPWPTWIFQLSDGLRIRQELFVEHGVGATFVTWTLEAGGGVRLIVRPFLSGRDYHSLHRANDAFRFDAKQLGAAVRFAPYIGVPDITFSTNGEYRHRPDWYRQFFYAAEAERGLDTIEDLASPGEFEWSLSEPGAEAALQLQANASPNGAPDTKAAVIALTHHVRAGERDRRARFTSDLHRAADAYVVKRGSGKTIMAGYPWFTDWGRDTFIAIRGLCLATGRLEEARDILVGWSAAVSEGMLPNRFPDSGGTPEFNSVDASLWYVVAVHELLQAGRGSSLLTPAQQLALESAVLAIVSGYARGTRYGIRMDRDALLSAGVPGVQLTWMDAKVGERVITPRVGKPVEIEALWLNALAIAAQFDSGWRRHFDSGLRAFNQRFWSDSLGRLADVIDVDHVPGTRDDSLRPNQILAVGGLPVAMITGDRARAVVDVVERELLTALGLRSLEPDDPVFAGRYEGNPSERDAVYHQGTVWPWLIGPFVEAWIAVRGRSAAARLAARERFLAPLLEHRSAAGLGHVSEIADGTAPFTPRGCPFQAWSVGELVRLDRIVLADETPTLWHQIDG
jgi:predicted glycogen debranching enzyme